MKHASFKDVEAAAKVTMDWDYESIQRLRSYLTGVAKEAKLAQKGKVRAFQFSR